MPDHYFSGSPAGPDERRTLQARLGGRDVEVVTATGVFSGGHVDLGTRVLLREVPAPPAEGDLLDLGCGWGPLALAMALDRLGLLSRSPDPADGRSTILSVTPETAERLREIRSSDQAQLHEELRGWGVGEVEQLGRLLHRINALEL